MAKKVKRPGDYHSFIKALAPRTLVLLRSWIAKRAKDVHAEANESLAKMYALPGTKEWSKELNEYRNRFLSELGSLNINAPQEGHVIICLARLEEASEAEAIIVTIEEILGQDVSVKKGKSSRQDYVTRVFLELNPNDERAALEIIRLAIHKYGTTKQKAYTYYVPAMRDSILLPPQKPDQFALDRAVAVLAEDFKEIYASAFCDIAFTEDEDGKKWYFDVAHGGSSEQGEKLDEKDSRVDYLMQVIEYDTLVFNLITGDLSIHMSEKRSLVLDSYRYTLSSILFGVETYWSSAGKFTLASFYAPKDVLKKTVLHLGSLADKNPRLLRIGLSSIRAVKELPPSAESRTSKGSITLTNSECLTLQMEDGKSIVEDGYSIESVGLRFVFAGTKNGETNSVPFTLKADSNSVRGKIRINGLDEWIEENHLCIMSATLEERRESFKKRQESPEPIPKKSKRDKARAILLDRIPSPQERAAPPAPAPESATTEAEQPEQVEPSDSQKK